MTVEAKSGPTAAAGRALARLVELSADLRAAAIIGADGTVLASTDGGDEWAEHAQELIEASREAVGGDVDRVHLGTLEGEVFAVPGDGHWCVAITERFTLSSLVIFDMRVVLREMARELGGDLMPKAHRVFLDRVSGYADEASAFLKRRKLTREPFARVYDEREVGHAFEPDSEAGKRLHAAAEALIAAHRGESAI